MTLILLTVEMRTGDRSVTLHKDRAAALQRLADAFGPEAGPADGLLERINQDGHMAWIEDVELPA